MGTSDNLKIGDLLWQPRSEWTDWSYRKLKKLLIRNDGSSNGKGFKSHSDVIIGINTLADGSLSYQLQGGNKGDKLYVETLTAQQIKDKYLGILSIDSDLTNKNDGKED